MPDNFAALNNLGVQYRGARNFAKAESLYARALASDSARNVGHTGIIDVLARTGRLKDADKAAARAERLFPRGAVGFASNRVTIAWAAGELDSAARLAERLPAIAGRSAGQRGIAANSQANVAQARGKLRAARQFREAQLAALLEANTRNAYLGTELGEAFRDVWFVNDQVRAQRRIDAALATVPLASIDPVNRPHVPLVRAYAFAGNVGAAKGALADFDRSRQGISLSLDATQRALMQADIAMAEKRYAAAAAGYRDAERPPNIWARWPDLARA